MTLKSIPEPEVRGVGTGVSRSGKPPLLDERVPFLTQAAIYLARQ